MNHRRRIFNWLSNAGILTSRDVAALSDWTISDSDAGYYLRELAALGNAVLLAQRGRWGLHRYAFVKGSTAPVDVRPAGGKGKAAPARARAVAAPKRRLGAVQRKPSASCPKCGYISGERCARFGCKTIDEVPPPEDEKPAGMVSPFCDKTLPAMICTGTGRPKPARAAHPRPFVSTSIERAFGSFPCLRGNVATQNTKGK